MISEKDIRQFIIPKLADAVNVSGRYKSPQCEACKAIWKEIQDFFDEKETERLQILQIIDKGKPRDWTK